MRPILIPIAAKTDANGAATINVGLERTGDWRSVKIALGTTGPAEWAAVQSGVPVTYGRGRRVTLGPELLQPDDTLQVVITGGPVLAQITGSVSGIGGSMQEVIDGFKPAPNTIALDTSQPRLKLFPDGTTPPTSATTASFTVAGSSTSATQRFTLPAGTVAIRLLASASGLLFTYSLLVVGNQSGEQYFGSPTSPGSVTPVPTPTLPFTIPVEIDWDTGLSIVVTNTSTNPISFFVSALFAPEAPGQAGSAQSVTMPSPESWQAPNRVPVIINNNIAAGANAVIIAAATGVTLRIFAVSVGIDAVAAANALLLQDTAGSNYHVFQTGAIIMNPFWGYAVQWPPGLGLRISNPGAAGVLVRGSVVYSVS